MKHQGYNARLDESLGMKHGKKNHKVLKIEETKARLCQKNYMAMLTEVIIQ